MGLTADSADNHLESKRISNLEIQKRRKGHELNYSKIIDDYSELLRITQNYLMTTRFLTLL